jgi:hypothetical protein
MIEGSGSISLTSGSGSGDRRSKNMWVRIRNTGNWKSGLITHLQKGELGLPLFYHDLLFAAPLLGQGLGKVLHLESNLGNDKRVFRRRKISERGKKTTKINKRTD